MAAISDLSIRSTKHRRQRVDDNTALVPSTLSKAVALLLYEEEAIMPNRPWPFRRLSKGLKLSVSILLTQGRKRACMRNVKDILTGQNGEGHPTTNSTHIASKSEPPKYIANDKMPTQASTRSRIPIPPRTPARL